MPKFHKVWRQFVDKTKLNATEIIAQRFFKVYQDHGVEISQIPRLIQQIKLDNVQSPQKLLAVLTPELLDQTAKLFGIRSQWLEGVDDEIYEYRHCYKEPDRLFEDLATLQIYKANPLRFPLRMLVVTKNLDYTDSSEQLIVPVLIEKIAELGEKAICRYHVYRDGFDWSYEPARIQLKVIARIVYKKLHTPIPLFAISAKEMQAALAGKLIPWRHMEGSMITSPSLEDYTLTNAESAVAKEVSEMPAVLSYIEAHNLQNFSFSSPDNLQQPVEPSPSPVADAIVHEQSVMLKPYGKREKTKADVWEPCINAAKTLWAENNKLTIAEAIIRIKKMSFLKASALGDSAIRKHIASFAPPDVQGKSGRKPIKFI